MDPLTPGPQDQNATPNTTGTAGAPTSPATTPATPTPAATPTPGFAEPAQQSPAAASPVASQPTAVLPKKSKTVQLLVLGAVLVVAVVAVLLFV